MKAVWLQFGLSLAFSSLAFGRQPVLEPMLEARRFAAAACLDDTVMVFGGANGGRILDSVSSIPLLNAHHKKYPRWKSVAPLPTARTEAAAAILGSKVYLVGGRGENGPYAETLWLSSSFLNWNAEGPLMEARAAHALFALNGQLIAAGGRGTGGILGSVEGFSAWTKRWTPRARLPVATSHAAYAQFKGEGWVLGGYVRRGGKEEMTDQTWIYDPKADFWRKGPPLPTPRAKASAAVVGDFLFLAGGEDANGALYSDFLRYDASLSSWKKDSNRMIPASEMAAAGCSQHVALLGGWEGTTVGMRRARIYSPPDHSFDQTEEFSEQPTLTKLSFSPTSVVLPGGDGIDRLTPDTRLTSPRWGSATVEFDGAPVLIGGASKGRYLNYVETILPAATEWKALSPLAFPRANAAAATDGRRMFVCGGLDQGGPLDTCEMFTRESGEWAPMAPLKTARSGHGMYWSEGRLCVFGGIARNAPLASLECWDERKWITVTDVNGGWTAENWQIGDAAWILFPAVYRLAQHP